MKISAKAIKNAKLNKIDIVAESKKKDVKVVKFADHKKNLGTNILYKIAKGSVDYIGYYTYTDSNKQKILVLA